MNPETIADLYSRIATQQHLLLQLYLHLVTQQDNPRAAVSDLESALTRVMASLPLPPSTAPEWQTTMVEAQREQGPQLMRDFFRLLRNSLPSE